VHCSSLPHGPPFACPLTNPLIDGGSQASVRIQRHRFALGAGCKFADREQETSAVDIRSKPDPSYDTRRREVSVALQAGHSALSGHHDASSQTTWNAPVHAAVQADLEAETMGWSLHQPLAVLLRGHSTSSSAHEAGGDDSGASARRALADATVGAGGLSSGGGDSNADGGNEGDDGVGSPSGRVDAAALRLALKEVVSTVAAMDAGTGMDDGGPGGGGGRGGATLGVGGAASAGAGGGGGGLVLSSIYGGGGKAAVTTTPLERLLDFLQRSLPLCEHALSQNETLNIYRNELTLLTDEEVMVLGNNEGKHIREERQFMDLELSNNRVLSTIEWHPKSPAWLSVAVVPGFTFEQRVAESALPRQSVILFYTLAEFSNQLVLEAPSDVTCMHWNPTNPNLLVVGCVSGVVALFDMSEAHDLLQSRRRQGGAGGGGHAADDDAGTASSTGPATGVEATGVDGDGEGGDNDDGTVRALHIKPKLVSSVEASYNKPVVAIRWLPVSHHVSPGPQRPLPPPHAPPTLLAQLNHRNMFSEEREASAGCQQFVAAGRDGTLAVWDIRYRERTKTRRRASVTGGAGGPGGVVSSTAADAAARDSTLQSGLVPGAAAAGVPPVPVDVPWTPQYKVSLRFGSGPVHIATFVLHDRSPSDPVLVGSEEGKLFVIDWAPAGEGTNTDTWLALGGGGAGSGGAGGGGAGAASPSAADGSSSPRGPPGGAAAGAATSNAGGGGAADGKAADGGEGDGAGSAAMRVLWVAQEGERPPVAMQRSPFLHDVFFCVTDFNLSLWRRGTRTPIFTSPPSTVPYTAARWSPSRPAVIFLGRQDGVLEVWDLLDSTIKPLLPFPLISVPITSMEFRLTALHGGASSGGGGVPAGAHKQLLAVGDARGSLHVLDIPLPLRRGAANEDALLGAYLEREAARVAYATTRAVFHEADKARRDGEAAREAATQEAAAAKLQSELEGERVGHGAHGTGWEWQATTYMATLPTPSLIPIPPVLVQPCKHRWRRAIQPQRARLI